jgi:hypothetical protein
MTERTERTVDAPSIVSAYDWGALGHVVDVGGGDGTLMIALLNEYPTLNGTVVDLPATAEVARKMIDAAGLSDRANAVAGDLLGELPDGEGYLLSSVLHEWSDDDACAILRNCARAAGEDGAVFVIEPDGAGGRGVPELTTCAENAGLVVAAVHTAGTGAIVELAAR